MYLTFFVLLFQALAVATAHVWKVQSGVLAIFSGCATLNFGLSHCVSGVSFAQNFVLVVCSHGMLLQLLVNIVTGQQVFLT